MSLMTVGTFGPTADKYLNGLLMGREWSSTTSVTQITYSFPQLASIYGSNYGNGEPYNNFEGLSEYQQVITKSILNMYVAVANLSFVELTGTQLTEQIGGVLRFGMSDAPSTAWAYYPHYSEEGGDIWFNNSKGWYDNPQKGNYAYLTFMHEIGHALGLKHPHESVRTSLGTFGALPKDRDSLEYTVMSYRSYIGASTGTGYTNAADSYPQSLMMYDIVALQYMYGANWSTNSSSTTYRWSPTTGEMSLSTDGGSTFIGQGAPLSNKIFMTVWDGGGGADCYDFSNYSTSLTIDLRPGYWTTTSSSQLAVLDSRNGKTAVGNIANALLYDGDLRSLIENAIGGSGDDTITGNQANNRLVGGLGIDTVVLSGTQGQYTLEKVTDGTGTYWKVTDTVAGRDGADTLVSIEYLRFGDGTLLDLATVVPDSPTTPSTSEINGTEDPDSLTGTGGDDRIFAFGGNDKITGAGGNDYIDGGAGTDTAVFSGRSNQYSWTYNSEAGTWTVVDRRAGSPDGTDTLVEVEQLQFSNKLVTLSTTSASATTTSGSSGQTLLAAPERLETPENMPVPVEYLDSFDLSRVPTKNASPQGHWAAKELFQQGAHPGSAGLARAFENAAIDDLQPWAELAWVQALLQDAMLGRPEHVL